MAIGWFADLTAANTYFTDERLRTDKWDALTDANKTKAIKNAYNRIYYSKEFDVPTYAAATTAQLAILSRANAELAYYLIVHQTDEASRRGLQAQGVNEAGIIKEKYDLDKAEKVAIPAEVKDMLEDFETIEYMGGTAIGRDEDEDLDNDPTGL